MNTSNAILDWIDTWDKPYSVSLRAAEGEMAEAKSIKARSADSAVRAFHEKYPSALAEGINEILVLGNGSPIEFIYLATVEKGVIVSLTQKGIVVVSEED